MEYWESVATASALVLWVLLPLIPAVLIYWLFPNTPVSASGILQGLTVKAGGAFGAYLIVLLVIKPWVSVAYNDIGSFMHPAWTIKGTFHIVDKHGADAHPDDTFFRRIAIRLQPELNSFADPTFTITVPEGPGGIPKIFLFIPDYNFSVPLKLTNMDAHHKTAEIEGAVEIREPAQNDSDDRRPLIDLSRN